VGPSGRPRPHPIGQGHGAIRAAPAVVFTMARSPAIKAWRHRHGSAATRSPTHIARWSLRCHSILTGKVGGAAPHRSIEQHGERVHCSITQTDTAVTPCVPPRRQPCRSLGYEVRETAIHVPLGGALLRASMCCWEVRSWEQPRDLARLLCSDREGPGGGGAWGNGTSPPSDTDDYPTGTGLHGDCSIG
jgi:hypothetical protein